MGLSIRDGVTLELPEGWFELPSEQTSLFSPEWAAWNAAFDAASGGDDDSDPFGWMAGLGIDRAIQEGSTKLLTQALVADRAARPPSTRKGRDALPYPLNELWDFAGSEVKARRGDWTLRMFGNGAGQALLWVFALRDGLTRAQAEAIYERLIRWSQTTPGGGGQGDSYEEIEGEYFGGPVDWGMGTNTIRQYRDQPVWAFGLAADYATLEEVLDGIVVTPTPGFPTVPNLTHDQQAQVRTAVRA